MHTFRDNENRTWPVAIHVAAIKEVRSAVGVDLYGLVDEGFDGLAGLLRDPVTLVDVLYTLCREAVERAGVSPEDFGRALAGDSLEAATEAFLAELTDFFPSPRVREALARVIDAGRRMQGAMLSGAMAKLDAIDFDAEAAKLIAKSGGSPGPSGSTPDS